MSKTEKHWTEEIVEPSVTTSLGRMYIEAAIDIRDEHRKQELNERTLAYIDGDTQYGTTVLFILGGTRTERIEKLVERCIKDRKFDGYTPEDFGCYPRKQVPKTPMSIEERRALSMKVACHSMRGKGKPYGYDWDLDCDSVEWEDKKSYGDFLTRVFTKNINALNTDMSEPLEIYFYVSEQAKDDWYKHFDYIIGGKGGVQIEFIHL